MLNNFSDGSELSLLILDDGMRSAYDSNCIADLFTKFAHHRKIFIINVTQNLMPKSKHSRMINLNCHYE